MWSLDCRGGVLWARHGGSEPVSGILSAGFSPHFPVGSDLPPRVDPPYDTPFLLACFKIDSIYFSDRTNQLPFDTTYRSLPEKLMDCRP